MSCDGSVTVNAQKAMAVLATKSISAALEGEPV
jgi:hypothetical protein